MGGTTTTIIMTKPNPFTFILGIGGVIPMPYITGFLNFLIPALIGGGASVLASREQRKATEAAAEAVGPEAAAESGRDAYELMLEFMPQLAQLDQQLTPDMVNNNLAASEQSLFGNAEQEGLLSQQGRANTILGEQNREANTALREADIADVEKLSGRWRDAYENNNDVLFRMLDNQEAGMDPMLAELYKQAGSELKLEGELSGQDKRDVQQASRTADNDRGALRSGFSIGNEVLNTDAMKRQRQDRARNFATQIGDRSMQQSQQRVANRIATLFDPSQGALGRQSINNTNMGMLNQSSQFNQLQSQRPNSANDFNSIWGSLFGAGANQAIGNGNSNAALNGGIMSGIGGFGGAGGFGGLLGGGGIGGLFKTPGINGSI